MQDVPEASGEGKTGDPWTVSFLMGNVEAERGGSVHSDLRGQNTCLWRS